MKERDIIRQIQICLQDRKTAFFPIGVIEEIKANPDELCSTIIRRIAEKAGADYLYNDSEVRFFEHN